MRYSCTAPVFNHLEIHCMQKPINTNHKRKRTKVKIAIAQFAVCFMILLLLFWDYTSQTAQSKQVISLTQARKGFKTRLIAQRVAKQPVEKAPAKIFQTIKYPSAIGKLAAYLSPNPKEGKKPAIIWITGGDCNTIGDVWSSAPRANDQTAMAFRQAGIIMMFPSLRGGNDNPGIKEGFLGEVDDVIEALKYLEKQDYVDPKRIYLGGHSTGGTLALLVAESSDRFRAVFAFGPVGDVSGYGDNSGLLPFNVSNNQEVQLRSPKYWLSSIRSPVWIFEGNKDGNIDALKEMAKISTNPKVRFLEIKGANHFSVLAPTNEIIAKKILRDRGKASNITFSKDEVKGVFLP
jgi:dipeptidyl aminopeptidase/acylaminoacyl peptidase